MSITRFLSLTFLLTGVTLRAAEHSVSSRAEFVKAIQSARPGDVLSLAPGFILRGGIELREIHGTESAPVIVKAGDPEKPPVLEGGGSGLYVTRCSFLTIDGLHFAGATGNGINVDNGGDQNTLSRGITLQNLDVRNVGPHGNCDGIKLSGLEHFNVRNCRIVDWGDGGSAIDMVGCHQGVVEKCSISCNSDDTSVRPQSNGVQMKGGSTEIVVRQCRLDHPGGRGINAGGSTGKDFFRPLDANYEARNITVEDCEFCGGMSAIAFVGVDSAVVQHNTIYQPGRWALRILQENRTSGFVPSRNGVFTRNIIAFQSDQMVEAVNVGDATDPESFRFEANVWHCIDQPGQTQRRVRLPVQEANGIYDVSPEFISIPTDLRVTGPANLKHYGPRRPID